MYECTLLGEKMKRKLSRAQLKLRYEESVWMAANKLKYSSRDIIIGLLFMGP